jgi:hypothetical protein
MNKNEDLVGMEQYPAVRDSKIAFTRHKCHQSRLKARCCLAQTRKLDDQLFSQPTTTVLIGRLGPKVGNIIGHAVGRRLVWTRKLFMQRIEGQN